MTTAGPAAHRQSPAAEAARALFTESFGAEPVGTWSAPGRVNLIGEHTDYNDGFVLPFAIQHRTHAALAPRSDGRIRVVSTFDDATVEAGLAELHALFPERRDEIPEWARYPLGVAWALLEASGTDPESVTGVDLAFASVVPVGAGLSSSAAIEGATAVALAETWAIVPTAPPLAADASSGASGRVGPLDRVALAQIGRRAENEAVGAPTGIMDQMASLLGRADAAIFLDCRSLDANVIDLGFAAAGLELLVIDTGVKHSHATGGYGERRAACERGAAALGVPALRDVSVDDLPRLAELVDDVTFRRVRHVVTENQRVLDTVQTLREQGPTAIGDLLVASHASMRDDFEISVPELDTAVEAALSAGAVGARMTGGGFGGAAIALVAHEKVRTVTDAATAAFAAAGFGAPTIFTVTPSAGAARD
ncbi:galactokinase [Microbacterium sp. M3]|uniref:Galactokinase n=1 Tax=Microbacterium arthrosphaerae TaxID=792652 RepID=A0ABU4H002_9MICO|nr:MULTISPECIES: galactokinase [Microbacterium]MDW4572039.1 galactokinase [Microbacterium arthrosphaerae]MDW7605894.1 galactokinase [Microbacterium sp. M3]